MHCSVDDTPNQSLFFLYLLTWKLPKTWSYFLDHPRGLHWWAI